MLVQWINSKTTKEQLTALHFASFKGNLRVTKMLIEHGANVNLRDKNGLTVIHVAAQGDQVAMIYYLQQYQKLDINEPDFKGSTALHWAAYLE